MAAFLCGMHGQKCRRAACVERAYGVRMAINGVRAEEPKLPLTALINRIQVPTTGFMLPRHNKREEL